MQTANASIRGKAARKAECIMVVKTEDANISHSDQIQTPIRTLEGLFFLASAVALRTPPHQLRLLTVVCFNLNKI